MKLKKILQSVLIALVVGVIFFIATTAAIYSAAHHSNVQPVDAIVVLGARQIGGKPSPVFQARLDHGLKLFQKGYAPNIILTGGIGEGERLSEAEVGRQYLLSKGIKSENIRQENVGRTSLQSLQEVKKITSSHDWRTVILVSDGFHLFRLKKMASDLGLESYTSPTQTSPITKNKKIEFQYVMRENMVFLAYLLFKM